MQVNYDYLEKANEQEKANHSVLETVCGIAVQLVFADKGNSEIPEIVGSILKGAYRPRQSA